VIICNTLGAQGGLESKIFGPYDQHKANAQLAAHFVRIQNRIKHHGIGDEMQVVYTNGQMDIWNLDVQVERWEVKALNPKMEK
jgi:hypothetical protein